MRQARVWSLFVCLAALGAGEAAAALEDRDGDLLPDAWEVQYGLDPADPSDAHLDQDGDRLSNFDEYVSIAHPLLYTAADRMTDTQVLDLFKGKAFLYFWEQSKPPYYFTPDSSHFNTPGVSVSPLHSIATIGFSLVGAIIADERGWVDHAAAYERARALLARAVALQAPAHDRLDAPPAQQGNRHGYLYHFVDAQGFRYPGSEISTIDHALFVAGALAAGEYYKGTEVESLARTLFLNTDWNWLFNGTFFYQGWLQDAAGTFEGGRTLDRWDRYSELLVLLITAMGHPDAAKAIPASAWDAQTRGTGRMFPYEYAHLAPGEAARNFAFVPGMPNTIEADGYRNSPTELHYLHAGSLHNHQYSHMFLDFRNRRDRYRTDFFANSISATLANRQFCINLNTHAFGGAPGSSDPTLRQPYETYGPNSWGLMAGFSSDGYKVLQPILMAGDDFSVTNISHNTDNGTVVLSAALGSTPFTPRQTVDLTRHLLASFQFRVPGYDGLIGRYGFRNAYNLGRTATGQVGHFSQDIIGLDLGPVAGQAENFETGLVWTLLLRNEFIQRGLAAAGFPTGAVEPFILNFDDNPPAPHEDPNGGGSDPNAFGGSSFAFGSGAVAYKNIGDPFPSQPYGPQQWAQRISTLNNADSGMFISLRNHSVSTAGRLSLWIKGATGGESYAVGLKDSVQDRVGQPLQATEVKLPIATYHPGGRITTQWTEVRIPLRDFADRGVRLTGLDNLSFTNLAPGGGIIDVDDIAFLGDEFAPAPVTGVSASVAYQSTTLTWTGSPEPDVVGYRVFRGPAGSQNLTPLHDRLIVTPTYVDARVAPGAYRYAVAAVDRAAPPNSSALDGAGSMVELTMVRMGDLNRDGALSATDALIALRMAIGQMVPDVPVGDANEDGEVKATDALCILNAAVGAVTLPGGCATSASRSFAMQRAGSGNGSLTLPSSPTQTEQLLLDPLCQFNCGRVEFPFIETVRFGAPTPAYGSACAWSEACTGTGTCAVKVDAMKTLTLNCTALPNLVTNGGFESDKAGWSGWGTYKLLLTPATLKSGETIFEGTKAAKIFLGAEGVRSLTHSLIEVAAGVTYHAKAVVRTMNATGTASVQLIWKTSGGATIRTNTFGATTGTVNWAIKPSLTSPFVVTPPANATRLQVRLVTSPGTGVAYFDGVRVEKK